MTITSSSSKTAIMAALSVLALASSTSGFSIVPSSPKNSATITTSSTSTTSLHMGMFDKPQGFEAGTPGQQQGDGLVAQSERETPIDRWFGWNTKSEDEIRREEMLNPLSATNFVDTMNPANYVTVELTKPMGIVFEENGDDSGDFGGIYVSSLAEGGNAEKSGVLMEGDQLVAVGNNKVAGLAFDDAFSAIAESSEDTLKLVLFRGNAKLLYGPTGPSQAWLEDFIA